MNADDLRKLVSWEMPFGKYKGRLLADLPGNYLHWFAREGFPPGELGRLLALMREIDHNGLSSLLTPLRGTPSSGTAIRGAAMRGAATRGTASQDASRERTPGRTAAPGHTDSSIH